MPVKHLPQSVRRIRLPQLSQLPAGDIALFVFQDERPLSGLCGVLDWRLCGRLSRFISQRLFVGKPTEQLMTIISLDETPRRVFLFGLGSVQRFDANTALELGGQLWHTLQEAGATQVVVVLPHSRLRSEALFQFYDGLPPPPSNMRVHYASHELTESLP